MSKKRALEYTHLKQKGEVLKTLFRDKDWELVEDTTRMKGNIEYWLIHRCPKEPVNVQRYDDIIHKPCLFCDATCPKPLEGLYNMMVYL